MATWPEPTRQPIFAATCRTRGRRNEVTLHHVLVRVATETSRHAGQADIIRELTDGAAGLAAAGSG